METHDRLQTFRSGQHSIEEGTKMNDPDYI
jgi:hypothetical protein